MGRWFLRLSHYPFSAVERMYRRAIGKRSAGALAEISRATAGRFLELFKARDFSWLWANSQLDQTFVLSHAPTKTR